MEPPVDPRGPLAIAVIGTGNRAQAHLSTLAKLTELYRVVAICDAMPERAQQVGASLGVPAYTDVEELLNRARPEAVLVTVPPEVHHTVTEAAAAHGAHVLCETPIAVTLPYADQMLAACQRAGVKLEVAENVWRFPQERLKRRLLEAGFIGRVSTARLWYTSGSYHGFNALRTHVAAAPRRVVGQARVVPAPNGRRFVDPYHFRVFGPPGEPLPPMLGPAPVATWEAGIIAFDNGVMATYEFPAGGPRGNHWEIQGTDGYLAGLEVVRYGANERYTIALETQERQGRRVVVGAVLTQDGKTLPEFRWENPLVRYGPADMDDVARMDELVSLYRAASEGIDPEYGAANARADLELLVAVRESALQGGQPLELPLRSVTGYETRLHQVFGPPGAGARA